MQIEICRFVDQAWMVVKSRLSLYTKKERLWTSQNGKSVDLQQECSRRLLSDYHHSKETLRGGLLLRLANHARLAVVFMLYLLNLLLLKAVNHSG